MSGRSLACVQKLGWQRIAFRSDRVHGMTALMRTEKHRSRAVRLARSVPTQDAPSRDKRGKVQVLGRRGWADFFVMLAFFVLALGCILRALPNHMCELFKNTGAALTFGPLKTSRIASSDTIPE